MKLKNGNMNKISELSKQGKVDPRFIKKCCGFWVSKVNEPARHFPSGELHGKAFFHGVQGHPRADPDRPPCPAHSWLGWLPWGVPPKWVPYPPVRYGVCHTDSFFVKKIFLRGNSECYAYRKRPGRGCPPPGEGAAGLEPTRKT